MVVNTMLVDIKHCFDPYYCKVVGVNVDSLIVYFFDNKEMALDNVNWFPLQNPVFCNLFEFPATKSNQNSISSTP